MLNGIRVEPFADDEGLLARIIALGRQNSKTLGFLPEGAFRERAAARQLLAATTEAGEIAGYLLYRVADGRACIIHLCVASGSRGLGISRALVRSLCSRVERLRGIYLKCRSDYEANSLWPKLGFNRICEVRGRSEEGHLLSCWYQGFGQSDLLSAARPQEEVALDVVADHNVWMEVAKLKSPSENVLALDADWLPAFEVLRTPEHAVEIDRDDDPVRRREAHKKLRTFPAVEVPLTAMETVLPSVRRTLWPADKPRLSEQDESDARHLAYTVSGRRRYFLTNDTYVLGRAAALKEAFGIMILTPGEFIARVDECLDESKYAPVLLDNRCVAMRLLSAGHVADTASAFVVQGERKRDLRRKLDALLAHPERCAVRLLGLADETVGLAATERAEQALVACVLRFRPHRLRATVARYALQQLTREAVDAGLPGVLVLERTPTLADAGDALGYVRSGEGLHKTCLTAPITPDALDSTLVRLDGAIPADQLTALRTLVAASRKGDNAAAHLLERRIWPARLLGVGLPVVLMPIQPRWAREFFDTRLSRTTLWGPRDDLILSPENVYYRAARAVPGLTPGTRILWYVSSDGDNSVMAVRACSTCEEVVVGPAKDVFRRFARFGIYGWPQVAKTAESDPHKRVMGIRFSMTSEFAQEVRLGEFRALCESNFCPTPSLQWPERLPEAVFGAVFGRALGRNG